MTIYSALRSSNYWDTMYHGTVSDYFKTSYHSKFLYELLSKRLLCCMHITKVFYTMYTWSSHGRCTVQAKYRKARVYLKEVRKTSENDNPQSPFSQNKPAFNFRGCDHLVSLLQMVCSSLALDLENPDDLSLNCFVLQTMCVLKDLRAFILACKIFSSATNINEPRPSVLLKMGSLKKKYKGINKNVNRCV